MKSLFERMADIQRADREERDRIRTAKPGDVLPASPRRPDVRPAFTGAGSPSFKPARNAKR